MKTILIPALVLVLTVSGGICQDPPAPGSSTVPEPPPPYDASGPGRVTLLWDPNPEKGITGYKVYTSTRPGLFPDADQVTDVGNVTETPLAGLVVGTTYFVVVTAYNAYDLESPPSEELEFVFTPRPPKPTGVRVVDMTIEVSSNMQDWRPLATVWGVQMPADAGFARIKMEEPK